ncbi:hypothetical protein B6U91_01230 [Candidatus Pacearchaeota archaeon ex4484_71]|nr:MAG: hypothetical protein B6U91_01230 [Candidatus Pacearchaeota archaeon ex4484_71]
MGKVSKKSRHLRWNWIRPPESLPGEDKYLYFLSLVDDKFRRKKLDDLLEGANSISIIDFYFQQLDEFEGKVKGTNLRYLAKVYESNCSPTLFKQAVNRSFGPNAVQDRDLYYRIKPGTSLEFYLEKLYS